MLGMIIVVVAEAMDSAGFVLEVDSWWVLASPNSAFLILALGLALTWLLIAAPCSTAT